MQTTFLDQSVLDSLKPDDFLAGEPFPWHSFHGLLTPDAFAKLLTDFPSRSLFTWQEGLQGQHYERPQDRWLLVYDPAHPSRTGAVDPNRLPEVWRQFVEELQSSPRYRRFVSRSLGRDDVRMYFTWHLGVTGSEVCPHIDKDSKVATHIFYFNTADDWDATWGGSLLVLSDKVSDSSHPDFSDFRTATSVENLGNRSFFFKNGPEAWHGVKPLTCPDGAYRRLFNVIFEPDFASTSARSSGLVRLKRRVARVLTSR